MYAWVNNLKWRTVSEQNFDIIVQEDECILSHPHKHDFIEILYFNDGDGTHSIDNEEYKFAKGDIYLINAGTVHCFQSVKDKKIRLTNILFRCDVFGKNIVAEDFIAGCADLIFDRQYFDVKNKKYLKIFDGEQREIGKLIEWMLKEYNNLREGTPFILRHMLCVLLGKLFRLAEDQDKREFVSVRYQNIIDKVLKDIDERICEINNSKDVLAGVEYDSVYFNRLFKERMGISIKQLIRQKKIERACKLLLETDYTVETVCGEVGYSDLKGFYMTFKQFIGMSPSVYRKKYSVMHSSYIRDENNPSKKYSFPYIS